MTLKQTKLDSPVGELTLVASDQGLVAVLWPEDSPKRVPLDTPTDDPTHGILQRAADQLNEYFAGKRQTFDLPLDQRGTAFQKSVWRQLSAIPFGQTRSYVDLARRLDNPRGSRAVGGANGRNPLSIVVPCHRVIAADGGLGGFAGGLDVKRKLLELEGVALKK